MQYKTLYVIIGILMFLLATLLPISDLDLYVKKTGDTLTGGLQFTDGITRFLPDSSLVVYDTSHEPHLVDADLERLDEMRSNVFTTPLTMFTFCNDSGDYINVSFSLNVFWN